MDVKVRKIPHCRWCAKPLRPNYQRVCSACGHKVAWHAFSRTSQQKTCSGGASWDKTAVPCSCERIWESFATAQDFRTLNDQNFPRQLKGYGKYDGGKFCTNDCALRWANKYAK